MQNILKITPVGNLGNQMFQLMLAHGLAERVDALRIVGYNMPEWQLINTQAFTPPRKTLIFKGQYVDFETIVTVFARHWVSYIDLSALGFRMAHYRPRTFYQNLFPFDLHQPTQLPDDTLLINVRGAEILGNVHPDYSPMPVAFYKQLIGTTGLSPVFMGQIADDGYSALLRQSFPGAVFIPSQGPMRDFAMIRGAKNVVVSVSTFSWLAAWLSEAQTIHFPVRGIFNPLQRPDIDLLPVDDDRYKFYDFPVGSRPEERRETGMEVPSDQVFPLLSRNEVNLRLLKAQDTIGTRVAQYRSRLKRRALFHRIFGMRADIMLALPTPLPTQ